MTRFTIVLTESAADDLSQIARYLAVELKVPATAVRLVGMIEDATMSLIEMPTRHAVVSDPRLAALGLRMLQVEGYIVFYIVSEDDRIVTVIRVLHGRRDWQHLL